MADCFWTELRNATCIEAATAAGVSGDLYAFGYNDGAYGLGNIGLGSLFSGGPTLIGAGFKAACNGTQHSLALKENGDLYATGYNGDGCLGLGDRVNRDTFTFVGSGYKAIAAGNRSSFAIKENGDLYVAGSNGNGHLGLGISNTVYDTFTFLGSGYSAVTAGGSVSGSALFLKEDGSLYGTGLNFYGELGLGVGADTILYVPTLVGSGYSAISMGYTNSLLVRDGNAYGVGRNDRYQLGLGHANIVITPELVLTGVSSVSVAAWSSLLLTTSGDIYGAGSNWYGELGLGVSEEVISQTFVGSGYSSVAAGSSSSVAIKGGELYATGRNNFGQTGLVGAGPFLGFEVVSTLPGGLVGAGGANASLVIITP